MEIIRRARIEARMWLFLGATGLIATAHILTDHGLLFAILLNVCVAVFASVALLVSRFRSYARATVDESGVTLRPAWQGRFAAKPFSFRWEEVRRVRRWPPFARDLYAGLHVLLDRPKRFWTFRRQPRNKVIIPAGVALNADLLELLRQHVPPDRIASGALDPRGLPHSLRRRTIGALLLLACVGFAAWSVAQIIQGGSLLKADISLETALLGIVTLIFCTELSPAVGLVCATWYLALDCARDATLLSFLTGTFAASAGFLSANVGALAGAIFLVLTGRPRWRHTLLFYALIAIGFFAGKSLYDGIPAARVATGHLGSYDQSWTPTGDGFLISTATRIWHDSPGPVDMQWYDENARPGNRLTLSNDPYVSAVGQEGALALVWNGPELWFLPRRNGPARKLAAPAGNFHISPSKRYVVFSCRVEKELTWERCEVDTGELIRFNLPANMKGSEGNWGKDDSTLVWIVGGKPIYKDGSHFTWTTPLPENGVFRELGEFYRLWVWKAGEPPQSYVAKTQWLDSHYVAAEDRLYVCRIAEDPPFRKEFIAIDFSGPHIVIAPAKGEAFNEPSNPSPAAVRPYEVIAPQAGSGRASVEETATGKRWFLSQGPPPKEWGDFTQWSPRGDRFLMTGLEWRMPSHFWSWRRNPVEDFNNGATVYMVKVESLPASATQKGKTR